MASNVEVFAVKVEAYRATSGSPFLLAVAIRARRCDLMYSISFSVKVRAMLVSMREHLFFGIFIDRPGSS